MFPNSVLTIDIDFLDDHLQLRLCLRVAQQLQDGPDHVDPNGSLLAMVERCECIFQH